MEAGIKDLPAPPISASRPTVFVRFLTDPFRISNTELPDNVLLLVKILTFAFIATGQFRLLSWHFLPFLRFFDRMGPPALFHWTLVSIFLIAAAALFYNLRVRTSCLVLGGVIVVSLLSSREYFENNRTFCACILLLAGLSYRGQKPWALRFQVVLIYFGAALNKVLQSDWRSGQFFWYWFGQIHHPQLWHWMTLLIPEMPLAQFFCWATIVTEFILVAGFLMPRRYSSAIWLGAAYHTALLVMMNSTFGMFYYAMLASYLAFVDWPSVPPKVTYEDRDRLGGFLQRFDIPKIFEWTQRPLNDSPHRGEIVLMEGDRVYAGFSALRRILLLSPAFYCVMVVLLARQPHTFLYHRWLAACAVAFFTPFLAPLWERLYRNFFHRDAVHSHRKQAA